MVSLIRYTDPPKSVIRGDDPLNHPFWGGREGDSPRAILALWGGIMGRSAHMMQMPFGPSFRGPKGVQKGSI